MGNKMRLGIRRNQLMWKSSCLNVRVGERDGPGMIITCAQIQLAGKVVERS